MKNKTCDKIRLLLVDYSDGVLPADESRQIAAHLAAMPRLPRRTRPAGTFPGPCPGGLERSGNQ